MPADDNYKYVLVLATFQQGNLGYLCGVWFHMECQLMGPIVRPFYKYNISQWNPHEAKFRLQRNRSAEVELDGPGMCISTSQQCVITVKLGTLGPIDDGSAHVPLRVQNIRTL